MPHSAKIALRRYSTALAGVALAAASRVAFDPLLGERFPLLPFLIAVVVAAWYGGFGPASLALGLSWLAIDRYFLPAGGPVPIIGGRWALARAFFVVGLAVALLGEALHSARRRAQVIASEARRAAELRRAEREQAEAALRESEGRFSRFMQHLPGLAWIKDAEGRYVYANDAAERAFGIPRAALYGKNDDEVFPPETAAQFREHDRRALARGAGVQVIETLTHEDGVSHHSLVSKFPIPGPDGRAPLVGGMAIDITDRMEMEAALREADRRKDEFLATLAHELRNPLAPIRNALHLMRHPGGDADDFEAERAMAERQVAHLARLVDDLMDIARISRGKVELRNEPLELSPVIRRAVEAIRSTIDGRGHTLDVALPDGPILLEADPTRLEQVLWNLLSNAAKYTEPGGRIRLSAERAADEVVIRVGDTGIGIEREMLPRVFEMFTQVDHRSTRTQGGLGIGLGLVKSLVEMHGGSITARSDGPGRGSEFVVRLPAAAESSGVNADGEPASAVGAPSPPRPRRRRILVVDDNADAATSLARLLTRLHGQEVRVVHDGPRALDVADEFRPDLVLLDIGMPGMDGYEVARRLRLRPALAGASLVALTGWGQESDRRKSSEAGFDRHLVKPVDPAAIRNLLAEFEPEGRDPVVAQGSSARA